MDLSEVMSTLKAMGSAQTRKIYGRHGAPDSMFGVKVADMKVVAKKIKGQQELAYQLFETGNADAMYLAGIVADGSIMPKNRLDQWAKSSDWYMICEYSIPGVAAESKFGRELSLKWMKSKKDSLAAAGWATYSALLSTKEDSELDLDEIKSLLKKVEADIDQATNRTKYTMNGFVISVGCYVRPLLKEAKAVAKKIGIQEVEMGETSCKVPLATDYIAKAESMNRIGKKRKSAKC